MIDLNNLYWKDFAVSEANIDTPSPSVSSEAKTAAKWWSDQLRNGATLDNGDTSRQGGMTLAFAALAQDATRRSQDLTEEKIRAFENFLALVIDDMLEENTSSWGVSLSVDYWPDKTLRYAAEITGINLDMTLLPWKTTMFIKTGEVKVNGMNGYVEIPIA